MPKLVGYNQDFFKRCTCKSCAAIVEYTSTEVEKVKTNYDYLGDYDVKCAIKCPGCSSYIFV